MFGTGCTGVVDRCEGVACGPCQSPITITVVDAQSGEGVAKVAITGTLSTTCEAIAGKTTCMLGDSSTRPGTFKLEVTADGYTSVPVTLQLQEDTGESCCSCGYVPINHSVALDKA